MDDLQRFRDAQDREHAGFAAAMAELRAGGKRGHWIWYVFPQLVGLGHSAMSRHFGIRGRAEAVAYLADDQLRLRLAEGIAIVAEQLDGPRHVRLDGLMGSTVDAAKLVSSLTLFETVGEARCRGGDTRAARLVEQAGVVLAEAGRQGFARCAYTTAALADPNGPA